MGITEQANSKTGPVFGKENFIKGPEGKAGAFKFYKMGCGLWQQILMGQKWDKSHEQLQVGWA